MGMMYGYYSVFYFLGVLLMLHIVICVWTEAYPKGYGYIFGFILLLALIYGSVIVVFEDMVKGDMFRINICPQCPACPKQEACPKCPQLDKVECPTLPEVCVLQYMQQPPKDQPQPT